MMSPASNQKWGHSDKPRRKRPKSEFQKQIARLDKYFSEFIRLSAADENGLCQCVTCKKLKPWNKRKTHAGHFISKNSKTLRVRWDVENVHPQCYNCNTNLGGNQYEYSLFLDEKYGQGTAQKLKIKSTKHFNPDIFGMEAHIKHYRDLVKVLKKSKGIKNGK